MRVNTFVLAAEQTATVERLQARTKREGDCWIWQGAQEDQRPRVWIGDKTFSVRRLLYAELVGPVPDDSRMKSTCGNPQCVNPHHCRTEPPGKKREIERAAKRAAKLAASKPVAEKPAVAKPVAKPAAAQPAAVVAAPAPAPAPARVSFVFDGSEHGINAFTAAPRAILDARASRSIKQILADAKGGIVIGKQADSDKRSGMRMANI